MNDNIISEFEKLIAFLKDKLDNYKKRKIKNANVYTFKIRQLSNVLGILKRYPNKITIKNYMELKEMQGIGKGSLERIKEILETKKLSEIGNFVDKKKEKNDSINDLEKIIGVGRARAVELYEQGVSSVKELKKKIKNKKI